MARIYRILNIGVNHLGAVGILPGYSSMLSGSWKQTDRRSSRIACKGYVCGVVSVSILTLFVSHPEKGVSIHTKDLLDVHFVNLFDISDRDDHLHGHETNETNRMEH